MTCGVNCRSTAPMLAVAGKTLLGRGRAEQRIFFSHALRHVASKAALLLPRADVLGAGSLGAATFFVLHRLTDMQRLELSLRDRRMVEEQVTVFTTDKAKPLL